MSPSENNPVGLVLSGGGARGAYQAGVLKAMVEIAASVGNKRPFQILTGVSAGAINASFMASWAHNLDEGMELLSELWGTIEAPQVFETDLGSISKIGSQWIRDVALGPLFKKHIARSFLDTKPLWHLIENNMSFGQIKENLENQIISAVSVTATDYTQSEAISFVQSSTPFQNWVRTQRKSETTDLRTEHIMASSAIPMFFPPINVDGRYFGDGCLRNSAPLSPAIHLGSDRLVVIGVRKGGTQEAKGVVDEPPSIGRVMNTVLNAVLMDSIHSDVERLARINRTIKRIPSENREGLTLRPIEFVWIHPSEDIGLIAQEEAWRLPKIVHYLLGGLGPVEDTTEIVSYLLFEPTFCQRLIDLGYRDAQAKRQALEEFFKPS